PPGKRQTIAAECAHSLKKKGFEAHLHKAPIDNTLLSELKNVSDEWLHAYEKDEQVFSQGMFNAKEITKQDVITIANENGEIVAFLNIIPDYSPEECTYDLIRKKRD